MFENIVLLLVSIWLATGLWLTLTALERPHRP
jgi:hypothetical protein